MTLQEWYDKYGTYLGQPKPDELGRMPNIVYTSGYNEDGEWTLIPDVNAEITILAGPQQGDAKGKGTIQVWKSDGQGGWLEPETLNTEYFGGGGLHSPRGSDWLKPAVIGTLATIVGGAGMTAAGVGPWAAGAAGAGGAGGSAGGGILDSILSAVNGATGGMTQAELAALIESGTVGNAGLGLEAAGLGGQGLTPSILATLQQGGELVAKGGIDSVVNAALNNTAPGFYDFLETAPGETPGSIGPPDEFMGPPDYLGPPPPGPQTLPPVDVIGKPPIDPPPIDPSVTWETPGIDPPPIDPTVTTAPPGTTTPPGIDPPPINPSVTSSLDDPNYGNILDWVLRLADMYNKYQTGKDREELFTKWADKGFGKSAEFENMLMNTYTDPSGWLFGPEGQALNRLTQNQALRTDSKAGNLSNDLNRSVVLQDKMMGGLGNYRTGLTNSANIGRNAFGEAVKAAGEAFKGTEQAANWYTPATFGAGASGGQNVGSTVKDLWGVAKDVGGVVKNIWDWFGG